MILTTSGIFLLAFSTWQFSVVEPHCCHSDGSNASSSWVQLGDDVMRAGNNWNNCSELHKEVVLGNVGLHMPSSVVIALALLGLVVR